MTTGIHARKSSYPPVGMIPAAQTTAVRHPQRIMALPRLDRGRAMTVCLQESVVLTIRMKLFFSRRATTFAIVPTPGHRRSHLPTCPDRKDLLTARRHA